MATPQEFAHVPIDNGLQEAHGGVGFAKPPQEQGGQEPVYGGTGFAEHGHGDHGGATPY